MSAGLEVADVFRRHGQAYRRAHDGRLGRVERRVMSAIELCRTAALGGHTEACAECGLVRCAYNSCRNRHCPKLPGAGAQRVARRTAGRAVAGGVLPRRVHAAGAGGRDRLPEQGNGLRHPVPHRGRDAAHNRRRPEASWRRDRPARRAPHLGPEPAPSSARSLPRARRRSIDHSRWIACRPGFFLPVRVLSRLFRRLFLDELRTAFAAGDLGFFGDLADLAEPAAFRRRLRERRRVEWVVYAKPPFGGPAQALAYLGRYTHRVAIANSRLVSVTEARVAFRWKDY
jgi:Putative transposase/Transposase zinc-binding domain